MSCGFVIEMPRGKIKDSHKLISTDKDIEEIMQQESLKNATSDLIDLVLARGATEK